MRCPARFPTATDGRRVLPLITNGARRLQVPFKLTPFYAAPELASAALETMRLGQVITTECLLSAS